ncbi:MAG: glycosyl hydrolase [Betaproteobacteria bacterium CG2_30_59_46]|nr:MAG: glycosyl hydrolase [Betaproteobacteria bacterium CG2_30_59_46]PIQ13921.1 MAG: glycosyl hydrolase [Hydrogenophilales bacterium CG18_big_fil_WC_8_21_14_2_50_58_12]PIY00625.1 MAG: glycosyl hydrolase [Hydrogenophilales bacterium CG_4_10_14_3_um_filter_58_23]PJB07095.1 MAG: glycosyl hydrolase [Hydrogenophilales bacterium CG_4_9_14_3_um_filter_59_35]
MAKSISLLLGVHAHQPVGNFPEVLEDAHLRCYRPFIHTLHRFPDFHFAVHFSGWLLDWLFQHYPEDMALLREMVKRGQVELFGAGDTEPVLAVIPHRDRVGQVMRLSDKLEKKLGQRPTGAWLTERVWEATVVPALADSQVRYVTVDDYHFFCAGKTAAELDGFYTTEEDGRRLDLFPISEELRYRFPFSPANEAVAYLEVLADEGRTAAVYFDDIEKFGIWPETYEWVYEKGWLVSFIEGVLASGKIRTQRYSDYHAAAKTRGVVYLPTTSYIEMNEWTLPAPAANQYADLVARAKAEGWFVRDKAFLRGGIWKNFLTRYPEANWMHKRMLGLSERLDKLSPDRKKPAMLDALYRAQANDAYWHGLFGGLYLPHLRRAVYHAIVELEGSLDQCDPRPERTRFDCDLDGQDEIFLHNSAIQAVVRLDGNASVIEFDSYPLRHNFADSLMRQTEHYHRKIHLREGPGQHEGAGIASAHDRVTFKHEIHPDDLATDVRPRGLFVDSIQPEGGEFMALQDYRLKTERDLSLTFTGGGVEKRMHLSENRLEVSYRFGKGIRGTFTTEINLAMPSCDGPAGKFVFAGQVPGGFGQLTELDSVRELLLEDDVLGGTVKLTLSEPARLVSRPHFSVSQSEAGFEKIMQAVTLTLSFPLDKIRREVHVSLEVLPKQ